MRECEVQEFHGCVVTAEVHGQCVLRGRVDFIGALLTEDSAPVLVGMTDAQTGERFAVHLDAISAIRSGV